MSFEKDSEQLQLIRQSCHIALHESLISQE